MTATPVLIIEDEPCSRKLARDLIAHAGYLPLEAGSAGEGLRLARERRPAAILMDIWLPDLDGIQALGRLRADPRTAAIPVLAVTALAMRDERRAIEGAGFDAYLTKPYGVAELIATLARLAGPSREELP
jgi:two-component system cell cycle response regulator DivK